MATALKMLYDRYQFCFENLADHKVDSMVLMKSPFPTIAIIALYLKIVMDWGPRFMENRKPYNIDKLLIIYNAIQILFSANLLCRALKYTYVFGGYSFICEPVDPSNSEHAMIIANGTHDYFLIKIVDLLDTVFFVLRKKNKQITFLHLYHHAGMVAITWLGVRFLPGGQSVFLGFINSAVHVVMYSYYLLTIIKKDRQSLWWKKYLTQMQILQFFLIELNFLAVLFAPYCGYPRLAASFMLIQNSFMLVLFVDFYVRAYILKKRSVK